MLLTFCIVMAAILVIFMAVDLHTTSQILKRRLGHEVDPLLGWALNSPVLSEDAKFWILAAWKLIQAALCIWLAWIAYTRQDFAPYIAVLQALLCVLYATVLANNLKILHGVNERKL